MGRRKRASMREGPLADLFRSTTRPEEPEEPEAGRHEAAPEPRQDPDEATRVMRDESDAPRPASDEERGTSDEPPSTPEPTHSPSPEPEHVRAYRVEESAEYESQIPRPKERLSRI